MLVWCTDMASHSLSILGHISVLKTEDRLMLWLSSSMAQNTRDIATTCRQHATHSN